MLSNQAKRQIMETLLRVIHHISSKEYQERVWIRGEGPEVDDFDETCNWFFDLVDPLLKNDKEYGLTENQYQILKDFKDKFEDFSDENSWPPLFIDTSEWAQMMQEAKKVLKVFNDEKSHKKGRDGE